jgi:RHS repeat-associated protein
MNRCTEEKLSFEGETWVTRHHYNELSQRTETQDPFGHVTRFVYDRYGRALETHLPIGALTRKKFDASGNEIETTDPLGNVTRKKYTILNKPYEITYPDGSSEQFRYCKDGNLKSSTDKNGLTTSYERDGLGRVLTKKVEDAVETYEYNHSLLKKFTNFNGVSTTYTYDSAGRKIGESTDGAKTTFEYDSLGRLNRTSYFDKNSLVSTQIEVFDAADRVIKKWIEDAEGHRFLFEKYSYDASGNRISETKGNYVTTFQYDGLNRLAKKTDPEGHETHWTYSKKGRKETRIDPNGVKTIQIFDGGERLLSKEKYDGKTLLSSVSYKYDLNNNLLEEKHQVIGREAPPFILHREYDAMNRLTTLKEPLGKTTSYSYTPSGQLKTTTKPDGTLLTNEYDSRGNLTHSAGYSYTYDLMGNMLSVSDSATEVLRTYTPRGLINTETISGSETAYEYDDLDRVTKITFPDQSTLEYIYNAIGISKVRRNNYEHTYLEFDAFGNFLLEKLIDGSIRRKTYDSLGRLKTISHPDYSLGPLEYDCTGNLTQTDSNSFTYDKLDQLTSEQNRTYSFDSLHNPLFEINELNQIQSNSPYTYTYDANGNLKSKINPEESYSYKYDHLDRLTSVNNSHHYAYDGLHRRILKKTPTDQEHYWYVGESEVASLTNNTLTFRALGIGLGAEIGAAVLIEQNGETLTPHFDQSGNLTHLGSSSSIYSAFGETTSFLSPWGFSSKRLDPETGFYNFGRRFYDPSLLRWINTDPLSYSAGINLYAYVNNSPLTHIDEYGLFILADFQTNSGGFYNNIECFTSYAKDVALDTLSSPVFQGSMRMAGGFLEAKVGAGLAFTPFAPIGVGLMLHGADNFQAGFGQAFIGGQHDPLTVKLLQTTGLSHSNSHLANDVVGIVGTTAGSAINLFSRSLANFKIPSIVSNTGWILPEKGGASINGRWYTEHALERMAPRGLIQSGNEIVSRGIPTSVVENAIEFGVKKIGPSSEIIHIFENVRVVTDSEVTRVITVISTGR